MGQGLRVLVWTRAGDVPGTLVETPLFDDPELLHVRHGTRLIRRGSRGGWVMTVDNFVLCGNYAWS